MSGIMVGAACMGNDANATFTVNPTGTGASTGVANSFTFFGYAASACVVTGVTPNASFFPDSAFGTASPPTINGFQIVGVYSVYTAPATTGNSYIVVVAGNATAGVVNTLNIGGTAISTAGLTATYFAANNVTRFVFTHSSSITSLFAPNGSSKQVIIT